MRYHIFLIASILFMICTHTGKAQLYKENLIAWWNFDDSTANDQSGHGYHGNLQNMNRISFQPGVQNVALQVQGYGTNSDLGGHVTLPILPLETMNQFTVSLWVKEVSNTYSHGSTYLIFGDWSEGCLMLINEIKHPILNEYAPTSLQFSVGSYLGTNYSDSQKEHPLYFPFDENDFGEWKFYCIKFENDTIYAYNDGVFIGKKYQKVRVRGNNASMNMLYWDMGRGYCCRMNGFYDDVRVYDIALSDDGIDSLYHRYLQDSTCDETGFYYDKFTSSDDIWMNNDCRIVDSVVRVTTAREIRSGSFWHKKRVALAPGFETNFKFRFSKGHNADEMEKSNPGADGICFVIQNESYEECGSTGGGLGYEGLKNAIVIEFDTFCNDEKQIKSLNDPNGNHVALMVPVDGELTPYHSDQSCIAFNPDIIDIMADGTVYYSRITYNPVTENLKVYLSDNEVLGDPVLDITDFMLGDYVNLDKGIGAFVGFSSGTGASVENHDILAWDICPESVDYMSVEASAAPISDRINIYPNPAGDYLYVNCGELLNANIRVFDVSGSCLISRSNLVSPIRLDIAPLQTAVYYIEIEGKGEKLYRMFIKK